MGKKQAEKAIQLQTETMIYENISMIQKNETESPEYRVKSHGKSLSGRGTRLKSWK